MSLLRPPVVLAYHGIGRADDRDDPNRLVLDPARFDEQLAVLRRRGYEFVSAAELADIFDMTSVAPARTAVLTFDDGWMDAITDVAPRLARHSIPATFFICPGWLGGHHPDVAGGAGRLMDAVAVKAVHRAALDVGSHSMLHRDLRTLDTDTLTEDLTESKTTIEGLTDQACATFAYPFGLANEEVEAAVAGAGYRLAFGWSPDWKRPWRRMDIPRMPAPPRHGGRRLGVKLLGIRRP